MGDTGYDALAHLAAELAAADAYAKTTGAVVTTPHLVGEVLLPTSHLLKQAGWHFGRSQTIERFAVLAQAAHRLQPHPGQWAATAVLKHCN